jgi:hypothetical protein
MLKSSAQKRVFSIAFSSDIVTKRARLAFDNSLGVDIIGSKLSADKEVGCKERSRKPARF